MMPVPSGDGLCASGTSCGCRRRSYTRWNKLCSQNSRQAAAWDSLGNNWRTNVNSTQSTSLWWTDWFGWINIIHSSNWNIICIQTFQSPPAIWGARKCWHALFWQPTCYIPNIARRSIWDHCKYWETTDRPLIWPYLRNRSSDPLHVWFKGRVYGVGGSNGAISGWFSQIQDGGHEIGARTYIGREVA